MTTERQDACVIAWFLSGVVSILALEFLLGLATAGGLL